MLYTIKKDTNHNSDDENEASTEVIKVNARILRKNEVLENENAQLKEKVKDDLCDLGRLEYMKEELETTLKRLKTEKGDSDDKIEELYNEHSDLRRSKNPIEDQL